MFCFSLFSPGNSFWSIKGTSQCTWRQHKIDEWKEGRGDEWKKGRRENGRADGREKR